MGKSFTFGNVFSYNRSMNTTTPTTVQVEEIRTRYGARVTVASLATEYGLSKREVRKILGKVHLSERGRKLTQESAEKIRQSWNSADPQTRQERLELKRQLAEQYGVLPLSIENVLQNRTWKTS